MIMPDEIAEPAIALKDQFFDLRGLAAYSSLGVGTLRGYLKCGLPFFKLRGKILVKRSEFDSWLEAYRVNRAKEINDIADDAISSLKSHESK